MKAHLLRTGGIVLFTLGIAGMAFTPFQVSAHDLNEDVLKGGYWGGGDNPLIPCTGIFDIQQNSKTSGAFGGLRGPDGGATTTRVAPLQTLGLETCQSLCDVLHALQHLIYFALTVLIFILMPVMIAVGGILILISGGSPGGRANGINTIKGAVIGLAIALGAFLIVNTFLWLIFNNTGSDTIYTYTGDALSPAGDGDNASSTLGTQVTWPVISCTPGAYSPITPTSAQERSSGECKKYCETKDPPQNFVFNSNATSSPRCECTGVLPKCEPACKANQDCRRQDDRSWKCIDRPGSAPQACGDGGTCVNTGGTPGCPRTDQRLISGTCPGNQLCCKVGGGGSTTTPSTTPNPTPPPSGTCTRQCPSGQTCRLVTGNNGGQICITPRSASSFCETHKGCWWKKVQTNSTACNTGVDEVQCRSNGYPLTDINQSCYQQFDCPN